MTPNIARKTNMVPQLIAKPSTTNGVSQEALGGDCRQLLTHTRDKPPPRAY